MPAPRARPSPLVSIVIPTMRRPAPLNCAMASALAQMAPDVTFELVIVDNDPQASARAQVEALAATTTTSIRYVHAPKPGVANARNAGVTASAGTFIAFLDDDEDAPPGWLGALLATQGRFEADAVFGPVRARAPETLVRHRDYLIGFFSRSGPDEACTIMDGPGCGCSLVRRDALPDQTSPFSATRNGIGGEDDLLFAQMKALGARFAWAPDAWVWEDPEPRRLTLDYTLKRAFAYGQGPNSAAFAQGAKGWPLIPFWTAVGAAQVGLHGVAAAVRTLTRSPRLAQSLDRGARGLGKMLWFPPFKIGFYGQAALDRQIREEAAARPVSTPQDTPIPETNHVRHQALDARAVG